MTGFENAGAPANGPTHFILRINHFHDEYGYVAKQLAAVLAKVSGNKEEIVLELEYVNTASVVEMTYKNVTSPADFEAISGAEKDGAKVAEKPQGIELE